MELIKMNYPIIIFPKSFKNAEEKPTIILHSNLTSFRPFTIPKENIPIGIVLLFVIVLIVIFFILLNNYKYADSDLKEKMFEIFLGVMVTVIILILVAENIKIYLFRQSKIFEAINSYNDVLNYETLSEISINKKYSELKEIVTSANFIETYRDSYVQRDYYNQSFRRILHSTENKHGVTEKFLKDALIQKKINIRTNIVVFFNHPYTGAYKPDLLIIDQERGIYICVEIDEPYILSSKEPIHYIGSGDRSRDLVFSDNNYFVVRFSEKQIIFQLKCVVEILEQIISLHNEKKYFSESKITSLKNLATESCWSMKEAKYLAEIKYRERLLNGENIQRVPFEKDFIDDTPVRIIPTNNYIKEDSNSFDDDLPF